jgi:hypothetical protein
MGWNRHSKRGSIPLNGVCMSDGDGPEDRFATTIMK